MNLAISVIVAMLVALPCCPSRRSSNHELDLITDQIEYAGLGNKEDTQELLPRSTKSAGTRRRTGRKTRSKFQVKPTRSVERQAPAPFKGNWALVGLTNYTVKQHECDLFGQCDIYAVIKVKFSTREYKSEIAWNTNEGNLDMHLFVPESAAFQVAVYDKDKTNRDDLLGQADSPQYHQPGKATAFEIPLARKGKAIGTLHGYFAVGNEAALREHELLIARGVKPIFGDLAQGNRYGLVPIANDQVEYELVYAKTGSTIPESMHGIWWMDQRGKRFEDGWTIPEEPEYRQVCERASDELLLTFAEAQWDPKSLCLKGYSFFDGSPLGGHWTYMNNGGNNSLQYELNFGNRLTGNFCFMDDTMQTIDLDVFTNEREIADFLLGYRLNKKPWGWDRQTNVGPGFRRATNGIKECHYPLFQIVDGNGKRTEHYKYYLKWANEDHPECKEKDFHCPMNQGKGTSLIPRLLG